MKYKVGMPRGKSISIFELLNSTILILENKLLPTLKLLLGIFKK